MSRVRSQHAIVTAGGFSKDRFFTVACKLEVTGEVFKLQNVHNDMKILDLKSYAEFATGIPFNIQRLRYLDEGDLMDDTDIRHHDIVPGAMIHMRVWDMWKALVEAAATNDASWVFKLGVTADSTFATPNSEYMKSINPRMKKQWLADRAFVALYIASHRGHQKLCEKLIQAGANVNGSTPLGRSALHVAAARGHGNIVDTLLEKGANINAEDKSGETPLTIAAKYGNKDCERHLFMFRWQQRAKKVLKTKIHVDMFAHQYYDSALPVWLKSDKGQVYYTQILPPGEFEGTGLSAPRRRVYPESGDSGNAGESEEEDEDYVLENDPDRNLDQDGRRGQSSQLGAMPAIREERLLQREKTPSSHLSSQQGSSKKKHRALNSAPAKGRKGEEKKKTFDDWLANKKCAEQLKMKTKKQEEDKQRMEEEDSSIHYFDPEKYSGYV